MTILVTGATGNVGGALVTPCMATAWAYAPSPATRSRASFPDGVETIAGDLTQPADWAGALEGVDGLFLLSGYDGMTDLLTLARDAGVRRAALLSSSTVEGATSTTPSRATTRRPRPTSARPAWSGRSCGRTAS